MLRIRLAGLSDAGLVTDLRCTFLEEIGQQLDDGFADYLRSWIDDALADGRLRVWLAELDGRIVGCTAVNPYPRMPSAHYPRGVGWHLHNVYVKPANRKAGIALALLSAVGAAAREQGVDVLSLRTEPQARALCERFGFSTAVDAMCMSLV